jgi:capsular polysaccharide export protein
MRQPGGTGAAPRTRLYAYSGGFFRQRRVRRILELAGYDVKFGLPGAGDAVAVWGRTAYAKRGIRVATWRKAPLITVEDAFLRSVHTGRSGAPPLGLVIDPRGIYFDSSKPSALEDILNTAPLDDPALLARAQSGIARLQETGLSKYNAFDAGPAPAEPGYVLVIDQTRGDASIRLGGATDDDFAKMLAAAKADHPDKEILIKTHPEVTARYRKGHFNARDLDSRTRLVTAPLSPWALLKDASAVYCVTSLMGFEAIMAGHRPQVFGKPFYGGWGLTEDAQSFDRRDRQLSVAMLFAGAMLIYPTWYDPCRDQLCSFETVVDTLESQARAWREDCHGYAALGIRLWKRAHFRKFFAGAKTALSFEKELAKAAGSGRRGLIWAGKETKLVRQWYAEHDQALYRIEDGFLRSRGLGAELVPPLSLVLDDLGIYYDPRRESRLERMLNEAADLPQNALDRAAALRQRLVANRVSKYNIGQRDFQRDWPKDRLKILVPGQVEDDASILTGAADTRSNLELLRAVRAANPAAYIIYKPHPDVEAGLRRGRVAAGELEGLADLVIAGADPIAALEAVDQVWTITSLLGFEALLRGKPVTCLGTPFYAGWGLTQDLALKVDRRQARLTIDALVHAALIAYPRYFDPVSNMACPVEVAVDRLESGPVMRGNRRTRALAKLQGLFAGLAPLWR